MLTHKENKCCMHLNKIFKRASIFMHNPQRKLFLIFLWQWMSIFGSSITVCRRRGRGLGYAGVPSARLLNYNSGNIQPTESLEYWNWSLNQSSSNNAIAGATLMCHTRYRGCKNGPSLKNRVLCSPAVSVPWCQPSQISPAQAQGVEL